MRSVLKALLYAGLLAACYWCGFSAYRDYTLLMMDDGGALSRRARAKPITGTNTNASPSPERWSCWASSLRRTLGIC